MPRPKLLVEAGFGFTPFVQPGDLDWTLLSETGNGVRRLSRRAGRRARYLPTPPTDLTLVLDNRNGKLDPANPNSPYSPNVKRDAQLRVRLDTTPDTSLPRNFLDIDQAHFQTTTLRWENNTNASLAISTDQQAGPGDERSLKVTSTAGDATTPVVLSIRTAGAGSLGIGLPGGAEGKPVTFQFKTLANTTTRDSRITVEWYDGQGAFISSSASALLGVNRNDRWSIRSATLTPPINTVFLRITIDVATAAVNGEVHYIGRVSAAPGQFKPWTIPGGIYPIFRGHVLDWDAGYDPALKDAWVTVTATDIFRAMAEHQLWPSVVEHDLLDGFAGQPPRYYFPFDEGDAPFFRGYARLDSGLRDLYSTSVLETQRGRQRFFWDPRHFTSFGGSERISVVRLPVHDVVPDYSKAWGVECLFTCENPSVEQFLLDLPNQLIVRIRVNRVQATLFYTDGTDADVFSSRISGGRTYLVLVTVDANGDLRLYLNDVFQGGELGNNRARKGHTGDWAVGARGVPDLPLFGEIGRVAFYDWRPGIEHASGLWGAHVAPWGFNPTVGARAQFLLEEFRHRKNADGTDVVGTYPGLPASLIFADNPSDVLVTDMNPERRSLLDYLRSLEATESGYLKVKANGQVRLRRRGLVMTPRKPGTVIAPNGEIPFQDVKLGRNSDVVTVVNYSRSFTEVESELRSKTGIAAHGEVAYTLGALESDTEALAKQAAVDLLDRNAMTPPKPKADNLVLRPDDPRVGWAAVMFEPGDHTFLEATLPQYGHAVAYEVLEANTDIDRNGSAVVELTMVGD